MTTSRAWPAVGVEPRLEVGHKQPSGGDADGKVGGERPSGRSSTPLTPNARIVCH